MSDHEHGLEPGNQAASLGPSEEYNRYWRTVVETMSEALMIVDPDGIIVSVNKALIDLVGLDREEMIGKPCSILDFDTCPKVRSRGGEHHCGLFRAGGLKGKRCVLSLSGGRRVAVLKNAAVLKDGEGRTIGAVETLTDLTEITDRDRVIDRLRKELSEENGFHGMIGRSTVMLRLFDLLESAARSQAPVVITGPSGTGKELAAQAIHALSARAEGPLVKVNCAALNESLLESELFGHVKGAFTGADRDRVGRFEAAAGGSLFLDEIGDLPQTIQVKLLRVLQEGEVERVGDHRPRAVDTRIITATNRDLNELIGDGRFREDLYYRIAAIPIEIPSLKERAEDIPLLAEAYLNRINLKSGSAEVGISKEALKALVDHDWPGNIRELFNALEYAHVLAKEGVIRPDHLPARISLSGLDPACPEPSPRPDKIGRREIDQALAQTNGNKTQAAKLLGISRVTLWKKMKVLSTEND